MITSPYLYVDRVIVYGAVDGTRTRCSMYPGIPRVASDGIATAFVRERVIRLNNWIKHAD